MKYGVAIGNQEKFFKFSEKKNFSWFHMATPYFIFRGNKIVATALSAVVITINIYFVVHTTIQGVNEWYYFVLIALFAVVYVMMCLYLIIHMINSMDPSKFNNTFVSKYIVGPVATDFGLNSDKSSTCEEIE